jgi:hypothetical protein
MCDFVNREIARERRDSHSRVTCAFLLVKGDGHSVEISKERTCIVNEAPVRRFSWAVAEPTLRAPNANPSIPYLLARLALIDTYFFNPLPYSYLNMPVPRSKSNASNFVCRPGFSAPNTEVRITRLKIHRFS